MELNMESLQLVYLSYFQTPNRKYKLAVEINYEERYILQFLKLKHIDILQLLHSDFENCRFDDIVIALQSRICQLIIFFI